MIWRAALASLLVVFLLSSSCAASACEMSCMLKVQGASCHHAQSIPYRSVATMHGCGMGSTSHVKTVHAALCTPGVCDGQPQAVGSQQTTAAIERMTMQQAMVVASLAFPQREPAHLHETQSPLRRAPFVVSLQTILRV